MREKQTSGGTRAWKTARHALDIATSTQTSDTMVKAVLANHQSKTDGDITGGGTPTALWTADAPIAPTPGAPGNFKIAAGASVIVSAVDQQIRYRVLRDGNPVGPAMAVNAVGTSPTCEGSLAFIDEPGPGGPYTYALEIFNDGVGTHNVVSLTSAGSGASAFLVTEETF